MSEPVELEHLNSEQDVKVSWTSTLLSFSTTAQRASEIEGDLVEEARAYGPYWYVLHVSRTVLALLCQSFRKAPLLTLMLSFASLAAASVLSTFLLFPFVFQFSDFSIHTLIFIVCLFRAIACFVVGAALVEYAGTLGVRAVLGTVMIMLAVFLTSFFWQQQWGAFGDALLQTIFLESALTGGIESISLYTLFSMLAIMTGGIYSLRNRQKRVFKPGCGRIDSFFSRSVLLKNK